MIEPISTFTVRVTDLASGGSGIARDETGRVLFIPLSAPGDLLKVRVTEAQRRYAEAEIVEIIEPSPERVKPPCPVFGRCGGCSWQHIPYALQWKTKARGLEHTLGRRQIALPGPLEEFPAERIWEYRNRVQLRGQGTELGFLQRGSLEARSDRALRDRAAGDQQRLSDAEVGSKAPHPPVQGGSRGHARRLGTAHLERRPRGARVQANS